MKLDVGCGSKPAGDVNVDFFEKGWNRQEGDQETGEFVNPHSIPNFVIADAAFLPFKNESFDVAFSSHTIEHVPKPFQMLREMLRVSKRKVIIRCPHRKGSGAKRPFHINYLDEEWFANVTQKMGYSQRTFVRQYDFPVTSRMILASPESLKFLFKRSIPIRVIKKVEEKLLGDGLIKTPFEIEVHIVKKTFDTNSDNV